MIDDRLGHRPEDAVRDIGGDGNLEEMPSSVNHELPLPARLRPGCSSEVTSYTNRALSVPTGLSTSPERPVEPDDEPDERHGEDRGGVDVRRCHAHSSVRAWQP